MNTTILTATLVTAAVMTAGAAAAQSNVNHNPPMPAVATSATTNTIEPAAGRNSFTQKQATEQLMSKGYSNIGTLKQDSNGIWRGTAKMNGTSHKVAVDYQGNVTTE